MKTILTFATLLFISFITFGQAGMPDPSFGDNGESLMLTNNKSAGCVNDIVQQPDGKIVAAGDEYYSTQVYNPIVVRYKTDGTPDSSFGTNGFADVSIRSSHRFDAALVVKVLSDNKILVLINAENPKTDDPNVYLIRLNADGSKDAGFGNNGVIIKDKGIDYAYAMQIQDDGKILLGGQINSIACIARCNEDGSIDTSFGNNGLILLRSLKSSVVTAIALTTDQKILVGGNGRPAVQSQDIAFINRYTINGGVDSSFGVNGSVMKRTSEYSQGVTSLVVLPGDAFLVSYFLFHNTRYFPVAALSKYNADGSADLNFGRAGTVTSGIPKAFSSYRTSEIAVQEGGKIVLAGQFMNKKAKYAIAVTRLLPNGEIDNSFGSGGNAVTYHYYNKPTSVLIQQDEKIVVGGCVQKAFGAKLHLSLSRYLSANNSITTLRQADIVAGKKVALYPNPVKDILHIHGLNGSTLNIVNMQGMIIKRLVVNAETYDLNVSALAKGIYYLKVVGAKSSEAYKFIKE